MRTEVSTATPRDGHDDVPSCSRPPDSPAEEYTSAFARGYARALDASVLGSFSPPPTSIGHVARLGLDQLVANAPHRLNSRRAVAQLFPKPGHMHVDGPRVSVVVVAPR